MEIEDSRFEGIDLGEERLRGGRILDVEADSVSAVNADWRGIRIRRVVFRNSRLTGLGMGEAALGEVRFIGCKLDYVNFRFSELDSVGFEDCVLTEADFQGARIRDTRFEACQLVGADFTKAELKRVDLRGSELAPAGSLQGLRGATIDSLQLIDLAPALAHELGIEVDDARPESGSL